MVWDESDERERQKKIGKCEQFTDDSSISITTPLGFHQDPWLIRWPGATPVAQTKVEIWLEGSSLQRLIDRSSLQGSRTIWGSSNTVHILFGFGWTSWVSGTTNCHKCRWARGRVLRKSQGVGTESGSIQTPRNFTNLLEDAGYSPSS